MEALRREVRRLEAELSNYKATVRTVLRDDEGRISGLPELGGRR